MSLRPENFKIYLVPATAIAVCLVLGLCLHAARNSGRPRMVVVNSAGTNNARASALKKDALKQLEDDLFKPIKSFSPENSLEGVVSPTIQPVVTPAQQKQARAAHNREKNWAFLSPEELIPGATPQDVLKLKEFEAEQKDKSKVESDNEKFLSDRQGLRLDLLEPNRKPSDSLAPAWDSRPGQKAMAAKEADSAVTSSLLEREQALKRLFNTDEPADASSPDRDSLDNVFGLGRVAVRPELPDAHKARMEEYKQMLGLPSQPVTAPEAYNPFASFVKPPDATAPIQSGLPEGARASSFNPLAPQLGAMTPALSPGSLQDAGTKGYGSSSLMPALPKPEPAKPAAPATFNIPKRVF